MRTIDFDHLSDDDIRWLIAWNREEEIPEKDFAAFSRRHSPAESESEPEPVSDDETNDEESEEEDSEYSGWSLDDLRSELSERGLPKSGKRQELINRLEADDEVEAGGE